MFTVKKQLRLIIVTLVVATLAVAGLLLLFGRLAAPAVETGLPPLPASTAAEATTVLPTDEPAVSSLLEPASTSTTLLADIVATVDEQVISRTAWQQATRLDAAMSQLARQPVPTAEETLDRLVNEIIVLSAVPESPTPAAPEVEARIVALMTNWQVGDETVAAALNQAGLTRTDLTDRVARLIRVETALTELSTQEADLNAWLAEARARAAIGLYRSLANDSEANVAKQGSEGVEEQGRENSPLPPSSSAPPLASAPPPELPITPYPENAAPDFTLPQLNGDSLTLSSFRGKPTLINFWASWCPPCRRELPALQAAFDAYGDGIGFVAVDVKEDSETAAAFVREMGLTFPVALDSDGQVSDLAYEVRGIPTTLFVDANGVVAARHVGPLDEAAIDGYLVPLLEQGGMGAEVQGSGAAGELNEANSAPLPLSPAAPPLDPAPDFSLIAADGRTVSLQDYRDKASLVLVFYRSST